LKSLVTVKIGPIKDLKHFDEMISRAKSVVEKANKLEGESVGRSMFTIAERLRGSPIPQQAALTMSMQTISPTLLRSAQDVTRPLTSTTTQQKEDSGT
jgi:hypothetical protein